MKVNCLDPDDRFIEQQKLDLVHLLNQPTEKQARPCLDCTVPCPCSASPSCTCGCSPECAQCATEMSSAPEQYPIEKNIVPLVYAFYVSRVCTPCWSCEGHMTKDGTDLTRPPQVWFYSRSSLFARFVAEHVEQLYASRKVSNAWTVRILAWGSGVDCRFALMPELEPGVKSNLSSLQAQVKVIAESFPQSLRDRARICLKQIEGA